eukprot:14705720-Heterocapsa_arctica.AAC.1
MAALPSRWAVRRAHQRAARARRCDAQPADPAAQPAFVITSAQFNAMDAHAQPQATYAYAHPQVQYLPADQTYEQPEQPQHIIFQQPQPQVQYSTQEQPQVQLAPAAAP